MVDLLEERLIDGQAVRSYLVIDLLGMRKLLLTFIPEIVGTFITVYHLFRALICCLFYAFIETLQSGQWDRGIEQDEDFEALSISSSPLPSVLWVLSRVNCFRREWLKSTMLS